jgi:V/A-type H+-transporting ATPase subunit K
MKAWVLILILLFTVVSGSVFAQAAANGTETATATEAADSGTAMWKYFAAALAVGISCIAGGIAVGQIGSAAMGAMSENPELSGKALPYAGLAEGICLWGFLVALLILVIN